MSRTRLRTLAAWLVGIALAMCWDRAAFLHLRAGGPGATAEQAHAAATALEQRSLYQAFYVLGTLWPWFIVAAVLVFADVGGGSARALRGVQRALFLMGCTLAAGGATEAAKIFFRRLRPELTDGYYAFRPLSENFWSGSNLGLPSSHAGVAFGAAFAMCWIFPRAAWVFIAAAAGCSISRMMVGAHYFSDVLVGAFMAFWIVEGIRRAFVRPAQSVSPIGDA